MYYFDWAATSPMSENSIEAYCKTARNFIGNPSSIHGEGFKAKTKLEDNRKQIASLLKVKPQTIYFTSGGTEANSIILNSLLRSPNPGQVIITRMEHSAISGYEVVLKEKGFDVKYINCPKGYINPEKIIPLLTSNTRMIICMLVNNVVGTIQNLKRISQICKEYSSSRKIHIHADAVQALGKIPLNLEDLGIDSASFSAHKFCGPRGVGILYNKNNRILPLSSGGGQESFLRGGTENLPGISAMTAALKDSLKNFEKHYALAQNCRNYLENTLADAGFSILSPRQESSLAYSPYILTVSTGNLPGEVFVRMMNQAGFCLSSGSACSNNAKGSSVGILRSMGFNEKISLGTVRISFGYSTNMEEVKLLAKKMIEVKNNLSL